MTTLKAHLFISFLIALILTIIPLPDLLIPFRPPWVVLLTLYVQFYLPNSFKVVLLIVLGFILDTLLATVIGEHAFALCLVSLVASSKARRFYFFSIGQQMALMGLFCGLYQLTISLIDAFLGFNINLLSLGGTTLLCVLFWPWIRLIGEEMLLANPRENVS